MSLTERLEQIRQPYIEQLSRAAAESAFHVEPALRAGDGQPVYDGVLATPVRCDLIDKATFVRHSVDAAQRLRFDKAVYVLDAMHVHVSPFSWDSLTLHMCGMPEADSGRAVRDWFLRWFDEDDANAMGAEGLYGVVHFIGDPIVIADGHAFQLDLGSAPSGALIELIETLRVQGAIALMLS